MIPDLSVTQRAALSVDCYPGGVGVAVERQFPATYSEWTLTVWQRLMLGNLNTCL
jgi:hypothetical protein